jgi:hypothetical protein
VRTHRLNVARGTPAHSEARYGETPERMAVDTFSMNCCDGSRRLVDSATAGSLVVSMGMGSGSITVAHQRHEAGPISHLRTCTERECCTVAALRLSAF